MPSTTPFDTTKTHIYTILTIKSKTGKKVRFKAIVDTGAPFTELSDRSLARAGYPLPQAHVKTQNLYETQKYSKIHLLAATVLGQSLPNWTAYVSRFSDEWGVDALIGLDFFRQFRVTIDYTQGILSTEPYKE